MLLPRQSVDEEEEKDEQQKEVKVLEPEVLWVQLTQMEIVLMFFRFF